MLSEGNEHLLQLMEGLANEKNNYFELLSNELMIKYRKMSNLEKLYNERKDDEFTFYMSLKEKMAKKEKENNDGNLTNCNDTNENEMKKEKLLK